MRIKHSHNEKKERAKKELTTNYKVKLTARHSQQRLATNGDATIKEIAVKKKLIK